MYTVKENKIKLPLITNGPIKYTEKNEYKYFKYIKNKFFYNIIPVFFKLHEMN